MSIKVQYRVFGLLCFTVSTADLLVTLLMTGRLILMRIYSVKNQDLGFYNIIIHTPYIGSLFQFAKSVQRELSIFVWRCS